MARPPVDIDEVYAHVDKSRLPPDRQFDKYDIYKAYERCKVLPDGWNWDRFLEWLNIPANQQLVINAKGADFTLNDALDMLNAPAASSTVRARLGMHQLNRRRRRGNLVPDALPDTPPRGSLTGVDKVTDDDNEQAQAQDTLPLPSVTKDEINQRLEELLAGQTDVQPQDISTARRLVQAEALVEKYYGLLNAGNLKPAHITALNLAIEKQSKIATDCQKLLGIDRAKRRAEADKRSDVDKVMEVIEEAGKFAQDQAIQIVHCDTLIGWVLPDFREYGFALTGTCPKCRETFTLVHTPSEDDKASAFEPEWVADEEQSYEAGEEKEDDNTNTDKEQEVEQ